MGKSLESHDLEKVRECLHSHDPVSLGNYLSCLKLELTAAREGKTVPPVGAPTVSNATRFSVAIVSQSFGTSADHRSGSPTASGGKRLGGALAVLTAEAVARRIEGAVKVFLDDVTPLVQAPSPVTLSVAKLKKIVADIQRTPELSCLKEHPIYHTAEKYVTRVQECHLLAKALKGNNKAPLEEIAQLVNEVRTGLPGDHHVDLYNLAELLSRGTALESQIDWTNLRSMRDTLGQVQHLPITSAVFSKLQALVARIDTWRKEYQRFVSLVKATPTSVTSAGDGTQTADGAASDRRNVIVSGQSGFLKDLFSSTSNDASSLHSRVGGASCPSTARGSLGTATGSGAVYYTQSQTLTEAIQLFKDGSAFGVHCDELVQLQQWIAQCEEWIETVRQTLDQEVSKDVGALVYSNSATRVPEEKDHGHGELEQAEKRVLVSSAPTTAKALNFWDSAGLESLQRQKALLPLAVSTDLVDALHRRIQELKVVELVVVRTVFGYPALGQVCGDSKAGRLSSVRGECFGIANVKRIARDAEDLTRGIDSGGTAPRRAACFKRFHRVLTSQLKIFQTWEAAILAALRATDELLRLRCTTTTTVTDAGGSEMFAVGTQFLEELSSTVLEYPPSRYVGSPAVEQPVVDVARLVDANWGSWSSTELKQRKPHFVESIKFKAHLASKSTASPKLSDDDANGAYSGRGESEPLDEDLFDSDAPVEPSRLTGLDCIDFAKHEYCTVVQRWVSQETQDTVLLCQCLAQYVGLLLIHFLFLVSPGRLVQHPLYRYLELCVPELLASFDVPPNALFGVFLPASRSVVQRLLRHGVGSLGLTPARGSTSGGPMTPEELLKALEESDGDSSWIMEEDLNWSYFLVEPTSSFLNACIGRLLNLWLLVSSDVLRRDGDQSAYTVSLDRARELQASQFDDAHIVRRLPLWMMMDAAAGDSQGGAELSGFSGVKRWMCLLSSDAAVSSWNLRVLYFLKGFVDLYTLWDGNQDAETRIVEAEQQDAVQYNLGSFSLQDQVIELLDKITWIARGRCVLDRLKSQEEESSVYPAVECTLGDVVEIVSDFDRWTAPQRPDEKCRPAGAGNMADEVFMKDIAEKSMLRKALGVYTEQSESWCRGAQDFLARTCASQTFVPQLVLREPEYQKMMGQLTPVMTLIAIGAVAKGSPSSVGGSTIGLAPEHFDNYVGLCVDEAPWASEQYGRLLQKLVNGEWYYRERWLRDSDAACAVTVLRSSQFREAVHQLQTDLLVLGSLRHDKRLKTRILEAAVCSDDDVAYSSARPESSGVRWLTGNEALVALNSLKVELNETIKPMVDVEMVAQDVAGGLRGAESSGVRGGCSVVGMPSTLATPVLFGDRSRALAGMVSAAYGSGQGEHEPWCMDGDSEGSGDENRDSVSGEPQRERCCWNPGVSWCRTVYTGLLQGWSALSVRSGGAAEYYSNTHDDASPRRCAAALLDASLIPRELAAERAPKRTASSGCVHRSSVRSYRGAQLAVARQFLRLLYEEHCALSSLFAKRPVLCTLDHPFCQLLSVRRELLEWAATAVRGVLPPAVVSELRNDKKELQLFGATESVAASKVQDAAWIERLVFLDQTLRGIQCRAETLFRELVKKGDAIGRLSGVQNLLGDYTQEQLRVWMRCVGAVPALSTVQTPQSVKEVNVGFIGGFLGRDLRRRVAAVRRLLESSLERSCTITTSAASFLDAALVWEQNVTPYFTRSAEESSRAVLSGEHSKRLFDSVTPAASAVQLPSSVPRGAFSSESAGSVASDVVALQALYERTNLCLQQASRFRECAENLVVRIYLMLLRWFFRTVSGVGQGAPGSEQRVSATQQLLRSLPPHFVRSDGIPQGSKVVDSVQDVLPVLHIAEDYGVIAFLDSSREGDDGSSTGFDAAVDSKMDVGTDVLVKPPRDSSVTASNPAAHLCFLFPAALVWLVLAVDTSLLRQVTLEIMEPTERLTELLSRFHELQRMGFAAPATAPEPVTKGTLFVRFLTSVLEMLRSSEVRGELHHAADPHKSSVASWVSDCLCLPFDLLQWRLRVSHYLLPQTVPYDLLNVLLKDKAALVDRLAPQECYATGLTHPTTVDISNVASREVQTETLLRFVPWLWARRPNEPMIVDVDKALSWIFPPPSSVSSVVSLISHTLSQPTPYRWTQRVSLEYQELLRRYDGTTRAVADLVPHLGYLKTPLVLPFHEEYTSQLGIATAGATTTATALSAPQGYCCLSCPQVTAPALQAFQHHRVLHCAAEALFMYLEETGVWELTTRHTLEKLQARQELQHKLLASLAQQVASLSVGSKGVPTFNSWGIADPYAFCSVVRTTWDAYGLSSALHQGPTLSERLVLGFPQHIVSHRALSLLQRRGERLHCAAVKGQPLAVLQGQLNHIINALTLLDEQGKRFLDTAAALVRSVVPFSGRSAKPVPLGGSDKRKEESDTDHLEVSAPSTAQLPSSVQKAEVELFLQQSLFADIPTHARTKDLLRRTVELELIASFAFSGYFGSVAQRVAIKWPRPQGTVPFTQGVGIPDDGSNEDHDASEVLLERSLKELIPLVCERAQLRWCPVDSPVKWKILQQCWISAVRCVMQGYGCPSSAAENATKMPMALGVADRSTRTAGARGPLLKTLQTLYTSSRKLFSEPSSGESGSASGHPGAPPELQLLKTLLSAVKRILLEARSSLELWIKLRMIVHCYPVYFGEEMQVIQAKLQQKFPTMFIEIVVENNEIREIQVYKDRQLKSRYIPPAGFLDLQGCAPKPEGPVDAKQQSVIERILKRVCSSDAEEGILDCFNASLSDDRLRDLLQRRLRLSTQHCLRTLFPEDTATAAEDREQVLYDAAGARLNDKYFEGLQEMVVKRLQQCVTVRRLAASHSAALPGLCGPDNGTSSAASSSSGTGYSSRSTSAVPFSVSAVSPAVSAFVASTARSSSVATEDGTASADARLSGVNTAQDLSRPGSRSTSSFDLLLGHRPGSTTKQVAGPDRMSSSLSSERDARSSSVQPAQKRGTSVVTSESRVHDIAERLARPGEVSAAVPQSYPSLSADGAESVQPQPAAAAQATAPTAPSVADPAHKVDQDAQGFLRFPTDVTLSPLEAAGFLWNGPLQVDSTCSPLPADPLCRSSEAGRIGGPTEDFSAIRTGLGTASVQPGASPGVGRQQDAASSFNCAASGQQIAEDVVSDPVNRPPIVSLSAEPLRIWIVPLFSPIPGALYRVLRGFKAFRLRSAVRVDEFSSYVNPLYEAAPSGLAGRAPLLLNVIVGADWNVTGTGKAESSEARLTEVSTQQDLVKHYLRPKEVSVRSAFPKSQLSLQDIESLERKALDEHLRVLCFVPVPESDAGREQDAFGRPAVVPAWGTNASSGLRLWIVPPAPVLTEPLISSKLPKSSQLVFGILEVSTDYLNDTREREAGSASVQDAETSADLSSTLLKAGSPPCAQLSAERHNSAVVGHHANAVEAPDNVPLGVIRSVAATVMRSLKQLQSQQPERQSDDGQKSSLDPAAQSTTGFSPLPEARPLPSFTNLRITLPATVLNWIVAEPATIAVPPRSAPEAPAEASNQGLPGRYLRQSNPPTVLSLAVPSGTAVPVTRLPASPNVIVLPPPGPAILRHHTDISPSSRDALPGYAPAQRRPRADGTYEGDSGLPVLAASGGRIPRRMRYDSVYGSDAISDAESRHRGELLPDTSPPSVIAPPLPAVAPYFAGNPPPSDLPRGQKRSLPPWQRQAPPSRPQHPAGLDFSSFNTVPAAAPPTSFPPPAGASHFPTRLCRPGGPPVGADPWPSVSWTPDPYSGKSCRPAPGNLGDMGGRDRFGPPVGRSAGFAPPSSTAPPAFDMKPWGGPATPVPQVSAIPATKPGGAHGSGPSIPPWQRAQALESTPARRDTPLPFSVPDALKSLLQGAAAELRHKRHQGFPRGPHES